MGILLSGAQTITIFSDVMIRERTIDGNIEIHVLDQVRLNRIDSISADVWGKRYR